MQCGLEDIREGADVEVRLGEEAWSITALEEIPFGFKIALTDIPAGERIIKYAVMSMSWCVHSDISASV